MSHLRLKIFGANVISNKQAMEWISPPASQQGKARSQSDG